MINESNKDYLESSDTPESSKPPEQPGPAATSSQIIRLGIGLLVFALLLTYLFLLLWPSGFNAVKHGDDKQQICLAYHLMCGYVTLDVRLLMIVMLAGGLGSFIHTATSFSDFVGNQKLTKNWIWWYLLKPFIGMILAVLFYLVVRGGLLSANSDTANVNLYGIAALAGMVGMFSKQATDKLSEVFDTLFKTAPGSGDSKRKDSLENPVPVLTKIDPSRIEPASQNVIMTLSGTNFISSSVARIQGSNRETEFKNSTQLVATFLRDDLVYEGQFDVTVFNPPPGGGSSTPLKISVGLASEVGSAASRMNLLDQEMDIDSCDVEILSQTRDEDLPASRGGVA